jgi:hypothetical protein
MGRAAELPGANPILEGHPELTLHRGKYVYSIKTSGARSTYSVTDGLNTISLPIQWSFGSGAQSWVLSRNGKFYEGLVSYFPSLNGLGITIGDDAYSPRNLVEAMGRELTEQDVKDCFGCHTTGAIVDDQLKLGSLKPGVTCEHCHEGAAAHATDAAKHDFSSAPPTLRALSTEDLSNFCGQCHRTWSTVVLHREFGEINVRFTPYRLALSECYDGTDSRISCLACHNPHVNVSRDSASYDPKCLACHAPSKPHSSGAVNPKAKVCPVAGSNCARCHMPKVKQASGNLTFTDHFIRIVKAGEPYPY